MLKIVITTKEADKLTETGSRDVASHSVKGTAAASHPIKETTEASYPIKGTAEASYPIKEASRSQYYTNFVNNIFFTAIVFLVKKSPD